jgi:hypothetical protein
MCFPQYSIVISKIHTQVYFRCTILQTAVAAAVFRIIWRIAPLLRYNRASLSFLRAAPAAAPAPGAQSILKN